MSIPIAKLTSALKKNWKSYLAEAGGVTTFMIVSCATAVVFHHPDSPVRQFLGDSKMWRRTVQAFIIGLFLIAVNFNPWGKKSGSHINPAVTLSFRYLGKISAVDAFWYIAFQCGAAVVSGWIMFTILKPWYDHQDVNFNLSAPKPEQGGWPVALVAEFIISSLLMMITLVTLHTEKIRKGNSWFNIVLIMLFIIFEAPFSGMSTNPARSLGAAAAAATFRDYWIYVLAPVSAMLLMTWLFKRYWKPKLEEADQGKRPKPAGIFETTANPPDFPIENPND
jgi:aquaporin Z